MKLRVITASLFIILFSCKAKDSAVDVSNNLQTAMQTYLYSKINNDSTNVHYKVEDVTYFEDKDKFICEFKVHLKANLFDTTGIMKANVSKDFKKVERLL